MVTYSTKEIKQHVEETDVEKEGTLEIEEGKRIRGGERGRGEGRAVDKVCIVLRYITVYFAVLLSFSTPPPPSLFPLPPPSAFPLPPFSRGLQLFL